MKLYPIYCVLFGVWLLFAVADVQADWDPIPVDQPTNHKMHYPQLPDLETGLNVLDTLPAVLADDFLCTETGPIRDVHIWGSWLNDILPVREPSPGQFVPDPGAVRFRLSLHTNIPVDPPTIEFSRPGQELWARWFDPGEFTVRLWRDQIQEGFYDPFVPAVIGTDTQVYQYNFFLDRILPLEELPKQEEGQIYWLDVSADPFPGEAGTVEAVFGWKSSLDHWEDDAVYAGYDLDAQGNIVGLGPWAPLKYPVGHPLEGQTMDLSFVITPEPGTVSVMTLGILALIRKRRR